MASPKNSSSSSLNTPGPPCTEKWLISGSLCAGRRWAIANNEPNVSTKACSRFPSRPKLRNFSQELRTGLSRRLCLFHRIDRTVTRILAEERRASGICDIIKKVPKVDASEANERIESGIKGTCAVIRGVKLEQTANKVVVYPIRCPGEPVGQAASSRSNSVNQLLAPGFAAVKESGDNHRRLRCGAPNELGRLESLFLDVSMLL